MEKPTAVREDLDGDRAAAAGEGAPEGVERFSVAGFAGEIVTAYRPTDLTAEVRRVTDPAAAAETLHWGRNYLYRAELATPAGPLPVVVKQFRGDSLAERLRTRLRGNKAARSFRAARALGAAGVATPEPVMQVASTRPGGPSFYLCRHLPGVMEARPLLRAARAGDAAGEHPEVDLDDFLATLGGLLRRMHDAGIWHRDVSVGNVLLRPAADGGAPRLWLVDLNRARLGRRLGLWRRSRDLSRLALVRHHRKTLLTAYWGGPAGPLRRALLTWMQGAFEAKQRLKRPLGGARKRLARLGPRRAHAHIPAAPRGASRRDKTVWDPLSDQPHQHAGRGEKLLVRAADLPAHAAATGAALAAAPRIRRCYRRLRESLYEKPVDWLGAGLCLRPYPDDPAALVAAVDQLGVRHLLLRLHPWQREHRAEEELARELHARGYELAFALPQNRELVRDPGRWRDAVTELAERFAPWGRHFQVGQAINRSKWGVWRLDEYVELARSAAEILRRRPGVELLGPAVIDFEHHVTAMVLNMKRPGLYFDVVSSLLYVDRRGAPENPQMGFDTVGKIALLRAIAETSRNSSARCWITEVNWPLQEGPHAPAGKGVAVDEERQANYLVRYYLLALTSGLVERVYWWQLVARGYGLTHPCDGGALARRPAFRALATLEAQLAGSVCEGPLPAQPGGYLFRFRAAGGREVVVGWSARGGPLAARLPAPPAAVVGRDGDELPAPDDVTVVLHSAPCYFHFEESIG